MRRAGPHESVNKTVLRCLQKVSIVRSVLRRVGLTARSLHERGPTTANDRSPKVLLQRCMTQTDRSADPECPRSGFSIMSS